MAETKKGIGLTRLPSRAAAIESIIFNLRSQNVNSSSGDTCCVSIAFKEWSVAMLSSALRNTEAMAVNLQITRTFVGLPSILAKREHMQRQFDPLERQYDRSSEVVFDAIKAVMTPPDLPGEIRHNPLRSVITRARAACGVAFLAMSPAIGRKKPSCSPYRSANPKSTRFMQTLPKKKRIGIIEN